MTQQTYNSSGFIKFRYSEQDQYNFSEDNDLFIDEQPTTSLQDDRRIIISKFRIGGLKLIAREPLVFVPNYNMDYKMYEVENHELRMFLGAESADILKDLIYEHLTLLWEEYGADDDSNLSPGAANLKYIMREKFIPCEKW